MKKRRREGDIRDLKRLTYISLIMSGIVLIIAILILFSEVSNNSLFDEVIGKSYRGPTEIKNLNKDINFEDPNLLRAQLINHIDNILRLKVREGGRCCYDSDGNDPTRSGKTIILDNEGNILSEKLDSCSKGVFTEYYCQDNKIKVNFDKCHAFTGILGCSDDIKNSCKI